MGLRHLIVSNISLKCAVHGQITHILYSWNESCENEFARKYI